MTTSSSVEMNRIGMISEARSGSCRMMFAMLNVPLSLFCLWGFFTAMSLLRVAGALPQEVRRIWSGHVSPNRRTTGQTRYMLLSGVDCRMPLDCRITPSANST